MALLWLLQQVPTPAAPDNPVIPLIGAGGFSGVFLWLWWTERQDRKETDRLLRDVYKESSERLTTGLATLDKAIEFFERTDRPERRGR